jgi:hypothetical protein
MSQPIDSPPQMLPLKDVCEMLVRHFGHTAGIWDISIELNFALGAVGPSPDKVMPGAIVGVSGIGITPAKIPGPHTVDASTLSDSPFRKA